MAAKSIVEVEIKDGQFRDFYEMFQKYQKQLSDMPEDWKKVVDVIGEGGDEMGGFAKSSKSSKEFLMIAAIQADAISKAMARATGVQDKFNTKAKDGAIQMSRMSKFSKEMHKSIAGMSTILLKLGTAGVGGIGSAIGAVYGATNQLAGQNLQARGLGLKIGQTQAFDANFEKFGLGAADLGNTANAQGDVSKWRAYLAAGLTPDQIQNEDAEQLTFDFARKASGRYREWQKAGMPAASMAQAYGFTDMLSQQQLRTGASYSDADWQKAQAKEIADAKRNAVNQDTADQASDVKAALKSDWAQVMNEFNGQLAQMSPELKTMGDAAAAAAVNLLKVAGPEAKKVLDALEGPPVSRADAAKQGGVVGGLSTAGYWMRDKWAALTNTHLGTPTDTMPSMLDAQYTVESGRGKHNLSPKGAMGPMQFMPDTWKEWGHGDVNNLKDSQDAAGRYDSFLLKRYSGDNRKALAAYNWGMGNLDKDIAANGDKWEQHAPKETQQYIGKIMALMAKQGQNVNINITNSTTANVATSMNAAPH
jgi:Transglycosylase SLT domain